MPGTDNGIRPFGGALDERSPVSSRPSMASPRRDSRRRLRAAAVAALLVGATAVAAGRAHADDTTTVQSVGSISGPGCGRNSYAMDSQRGVIIDVRDTSYGCPQGTAAAITMVAYSTSTLHQVATARLVSPPSTAAGWLEGYTFQSPVVDTLRQRIFVPVYNQTTATFYTLVFRVADLLGGASLLRPVLTINMPSVPRASTPPTTQNPAGPAGDTAAGAVGPSIIPYAMAVDSSAGVLDVLSGTQSGTFVPVLSTHGPAANDLYIEELDAGTGAVRWERSLGQCSASFSGALISTNAVPMQDPVMRVRGSKGNDEVVAGCVSDRGPYLLGGGTLQQNPATAGLAGGSMLTYVVPLDGSGMPTGSPPFYLGRPAALGGLADPDQGRMFYANAPVNQGTSAATAASPTAVTFDLAHGVYIDASTVNGASVLDGGYAIGVGRGRLYGAGPAGIFVISASNTPPGQGERFPVFNCYAQTVLVDPATNRIFVQRYARCDQNGAAAGATDPIYQPRLDVLQDDTPDITLTLSNPDGHTQDIAEVPGTTQATFSGRTKATAVRVRLVGGTRSVIDSSTFGVYGPVTGNDAAQLPGDYSTREFDFANAIDADLDNFQSNASAIAVAADESTRGQLTQQTTVTLGNPNHPTLSHPGLAWPFLEAHCNGSKPDSRTLAGTDADVSCSQGKASTAHSTVGSLSMLVGQPGLLSVGGGEVRSTTQLTDDGMVTTVTSVVHGVVLGSVAIDSINASLTCKAHGRSGTASCSYTRSLHGVTNAGVPLGPGSCTDKTGTPTAAQCSTLITAINNVEPGYLTVTLGSPDTGAGLFGGTPHGYQAAGQKAEFEYLQDRTLNYDNSLQVPGLDVLYVQDSQGAPSRIDIQLAGAEAESHYGITKFTPLSDGGIIIVPPVNVPTESGSGLGGGLTAPLPPLPPTVVTTPPPPARVFFPGTVVQKILDAVGLLWRSPGTAILAALLIALLGAPLAVARRRARLMHQLEVM